MTKLEILARANELWEGVCSVQQLPGSGGDWLINCVGRLHIMDVDGNPNCHPACKGKQQEVTK